MNAQLNQLDKVNSVSTQEGDHTPIDGMTANLNCWLTRSLTILKLFDSLNKGLLDLAGKLQVLGKESSDEIKFWSGNDAHGDTWGGPWDRKDVESRLCPGLQYFVTHDSGCDGFTPTMQLMQGHIANVQLEFNNKTTNMQTKIDLVKDGASGVESEDNSLLQSMTSGIISVKQSESSIRIN